MSSKLRTLFEKWLKPGRIWKEIILDLHDMLDDSDLSANAKSGISYLACVVFTPMCSKCDDGKAFSWMNRFAKAYMNNEPNLPQFYEGCWKEECKAIAKEDAFEYNLDKEFRELLEEWLDKHSPEIPYYLNNVIDYDENETLKICDTHRKAIAYLASNYDTPEKIDKKVIEWLNQYAIAYLNGTELPTLDVLYLGE